MRAARGCLVDVGRRAIPFMALALYCNNHSLLHLIASILQCCSLLFLERPAHYRHFLIIVLKYASCPLINRVCCLVHATSSLLTRAGYNIIFPLKPWRSERQSIANKFVILLIRSELEENSGIYNCHTWNVYMYFSCLFSDSVRSCWTSRKGKLRLTICKWKESSRYSMILYKVSSRHAVRLFTPNSFTHMNANKCNEPRERRIAKVALVRVQFQDIIFACCILSFRRNAGGASPSFFRDRQKQKKRSVHPHSFIYPRNIWFCGAGLATYMYPALDWTSTNIARCLPIARRRKGKRGGFRCKIRHVCSISQLFFVVCTNDRAPRRAGIGHHHRRSRCRSHSARRSRRVDLASSGTIPDGATSSSGGAARAIQSRRIMFY